ncbi:MAG: hypothetical protein FJ118_13920 [Deltaproteobacteria bacterium]|nr:hypothetical protein [Deltaproteobacteria bacterium]
MSVDEWKLHDQFDLEGLWWLPQESDRRIRGKLKFDRSQPITLRLEGELGRPDLRGDVRPFTPRVILGETTEGKAVTLVDAWEYQRADTISAGISTFLGETVYLGAHFDSLTNIRFRRLYIECTELHGWLGVNVPLNYDDAPGNKAFHIRFSDLGLKETFVCQVHVPRIRVAFVNKTAFSQASPWICHMATDPCISITPQEPKGLEWYLRVSSRISQLLTHLLWKPVSLVRVWGRLPLSAEEKGTGLQTDPVFIYFRHSYVGKESNVPEHVFRFPQVRPIFEKLLNGWLSNAEMLGIAYDLCAHSFYEEDAVLEVNFLLVCHALESLHRMIKRGKYVHSSEYEEIKRVMTDAIPSGTIDPLRQKLSAVLRWANEYSFRRRIDALIKMVDPECYELIVVDGDRFRDQITDTRNRLTHNDPSFSGRYLEREDLLRLYVRARAMLVLLLLKEAGLPLQLAAEAIKNTWHLKGQLQNARLHA